VDAVQLSLGPDIGGRLPTRALLLEVRRHLLLGWLAEGVGIVLLRSALVLGCLGPGGLAFASNLDVGAGDSCN